jgi:hypothetical protein
MPDKSGYHDRSIGFCRSSLTTQEVEILNPNIEILNKSQIQNSNVLNTVFHFGIRALDLFRV